MNARYHTLAKSLMCIALLLPSLFAAAEEFETAKSNRAFEFPRDHGSHPSFRTEWWYITGHLDAPDGKRFGFQVTFFRQAALVNGEPLFLAHCALLDAARGTFIHEERLNREGWDAKASVEGLDVNNGNWSLRMDGKDIHLESTVHSDAALSLTLTPTKPLVTFGKDGVSQKGKSPEAASHYLTFPRLACSGTVSSGKESMAVHGEAWMDHEFSSSQLDANQVGWDWASLQLFDGSEIMVYRMRLSDGSTDPFGTTLAWIDKPGTVRHVDASAFSWKAARNWTSPRTGAKYPVGARIESEGKTFVLSPVRDDQELGGEVSGLPYWEGACDVRDADGKTIGRAFLELAGYAGDLAGHLRGKSKP